MADTLKEAAAKQLEAALNYVVQNEELILQAHLQLGIPLEESISSAVRRVLSGNTSDASRQLTLPVENRRRG